MSRGKKGFNQHKILGDTTIIYLPKRDGKIFETIIDTEDLEKVKACQVSWNEAYYKRILSSYAQATRYLGMVDGKPKYKTLYLQKIVMDCSDEFSVDHRNHNGLDNRKENLCIVTTQENNVNRRGANPNNRSSGCRNVSWDKDGSRWIVQIQVDGKNKCLGRFKEDELEEAVAFAEEMRQKHYYEKIYNPFT
jgi:hypothetical protein